MNIKPGTYRHFKGNYYEVIGTASHSETMEPMVVYRALYGEGGLWVRPAAMWNELVEKDNCWSPVSACGGSQLTQQKGLLQNSKMNR